MLVGRLACMERHLDPRAGGFASIRSSPWSGFRTRAAEVHEHPIGRGKTRVRLLGPARDNAPTLRRPTVVVHMPPHGHAGGETLAQNRCAWLPAPPSGRRGRLHRARFLSRNPPSPGGVLFDSPASCQPFETLPCARAAGIGGLEQLWGAPHQMIAPRS